MTKTIYVKLTENGSYSLIQKSTPGKTISGSLIYEVVNVPNDITDKKALFNLNQRCMYVPIDCYTIDYQSKGLVNRIVKKAYS